MYSEYIKYFSSLNTAKKDGVNAPHKAVLLMSVIDLIEVGHIASPRIDLTERLEDKFFQNWKRYVGLSSPFDAKIATPFWHMKSEPFWDLEVDAPADVNFNQYSTKHLRECTHAIIDEKLFNVLKSRSARSELKMVLISEYLQKSDPMLVTSAQVHEENLVSSVSEPIIEDDLDNDKIVVGEHIQTTVNKINRFLAKHGYNPDEYRGGNISASSQDAEYLLSMTKTYLSDPAKVNDTKAKYYIVRYYNSWFDYGVYDDMSFYPESMQIKYAQGYYEIVKCAIEQNKTHLINEQVSLFMLAAFGLRIYELLTKEMTLVNHSLEMMSDKMLAGDLSMADLPRFEALQKKQQEVLAIQGYLREVTALAETYNGGKVYFNKID